VGTWSITIPFIFFAWQKSFASNVFVATLASAVSTAVLTGTETGVSQVFAGSGGSCLRFPHRFLFTPLKA
jgi:hypothetical protein